VATVTHSVTERHICQYHNHEFTGKSKLSRRTPSKEQYPIPCLSHSQYQSAEVVSLRAQIRGSARKPLEHDVCMKSSFPISGLCTARLDNMRNTSNGRMAQIVAEGDGQPRCFESRGVIQQHWASIQYCQLRHVEAKYSQEALCYPNAVPFRYKCFPQCRDTPQELI